MLRSLRPASLLVAMSCVLSAPTLTAQVATGSNAQTAPSSSPYNFFKRWQARASATQAKQPRWMVPVLSPYPMLAQVFRPEFSRQISSTHVHNWNLGNSRGLNLIPFARTEVDILLPPFFEHGDKTLDGAGDMGFLGKYRLFSGNESHGNYILSAQLIGTIPTGSYKNGATDATVSPTLAGGKGWGSFDVFTNIGGTLPTGNTKIIGRTITTNTVAQYHIGKYLWPEFGINSTAWCGSARDGKVQTFLTPGLMIGKLPITHDERARRRVAAGVAFQTAATTYHTYNHALVFTGRYIF